MRNSERIKSWKIYRQCLLAFYFLLCLFSSGAHFFVDLMRFIQINEHKKRTPNRSVQNVYAKNASTDRKLKFLIRNHNSVIRTLFDFRNSPKLSFTDWNKYLDEVSKSKSMDANDIRGQLIDCGKPGFSRTTVRFVFDREHKQLKCTILYKSVLVP